MSSTAVSSDGGLFRHISDVLFRHPRWLLLLLLAPPLLTQHIIQFLYLYPKLVSLTFSPHMTPSNFWGKMLHDVSLELICDIIMIVRMVVMLLIIGVVVEIMAPPLAVATILTTTVVVVVA